MAPHALLMAAAALIAAMAAAFAAAALVGSTSHAGLVSPSVDFDLLFHTAALWQNNMIDTDTDRMSPIHIQPYVHQDDHAEHDVANAAARCTE